VHPREIGPRLAKITSCSVAWDKNTRDFYSRDASQYTLRPAAITFPKSEKEIIKILRFASRHKIPVTPRGGGTGLVGGALGRGIILDMRNFNKIRIGRNFIEAGAGVFKGEADKELTRHGRFLAPNPSIGPHCTIGGMVGTNASGSRSLKYGSTIDSLISVRIITSSGKAVNLPCNVSVAKKLFRVLDPRVLGKFPKVSKNSCGYRIDRVPTTSQVQKIIAGSEGTLGVVVSAKLKTIPIPRKMALVVASYRTLREALGEVPRILKVGPSALEVIDDNIVAHMGKEWPKGKVLLYIELDDDISKKRSKVRRITGTRNARFTTNAGKIRQWWSYRNTALSYSLRSISKDEVILPSIEDAAVPVHRLPLLLDLVEHLKSRYRMRVIIYGHAGNGNLHIRPILKKGQSAIMRQIAAEFFHGVISMGGTITGEHGDGLSRTGFVKLQYGGDTYSVFKHVKELFDPAYALNPDKIITRIR